MPMDMYKTDRQFHYVLIMGNTEPKGLVRVIRNKDSV